MIRSLPTALLLASLAACVPAGGFSADRKLVVPGDAGAVEDAAVLPDTGASEDAGAGEDSGVDAGADAGVPEDSGTEDAGVVDSGSAQDAGTVDSGSTQDAGTVDSGSTQDAGTPDSGSTVDAGTLPGPDPSLSCDNQVYSGGSAAVCDTLFVGRHDSDPTRRQLLDRCGNPFIFRGVEQELYDEHREGGWAWLLDILDFNMNAIRILPRRLESDISSEELDQILTMLRQAQLVVWISPTEDDTSARDWYDEWIRTRMGAIIKHQDHVIVDALPEVNAWDCAGVWLPRAKASVPIFRTMTYNGEYLRTPLSVMGDGYGRNITCSLDRGGEVAALDPLKNVLIGWQAYWTTDWYRNTFGDPDGLMQRVLDNDAFPIQVGLTTNPSDDGFAYAYYREFMEDAEGVGTSGRIGYLWWHWRGADEGLRNGENTTYTDYGQIVLYDAPYAFSKQTGNQKACFPD